MSTFGVVVTCCGRDVHLARGCCASIRHFLGDVPICLRVDDHVDVGDFRRNYGVTVIRNEDVADPGLHAACHGWGRSAMSSFWEAPWPTFLSVDADTCVWGNVRRHAHFDRFDMIVDRHLADIFPGTAGSIALAAFLGEAEIARLRRKHQHVRTWFFDPAGLGEAFPGTDWESAIDRLFCPGAMFARRGVLSRERFLAFVEMGRRIPGLFSPGNMGVLNALVIAEGIPVEQRPDLHQIVHTTTRADLARRFPVDGDRGPVVGDEAQVIHWAGRMKPTLDGRIAYSDPMTFFRRRFLQDLGHSDRRRIDAVLAAEDDIYRDLPAEDGEPSLSEAASRS